MYLFVHVCTCTSQTRGGPHRSDVSAFLPPPLSAVLVLEGPGPARMWVSSRGTQLQRYPQRTPSLPDVPLSRAGWGPASAADTLLRKPLSPCTTWPPGLPTLLQSSCSTWPDSTTCVQLSTVQNPNVRLCLRSLRTSINPSVPTSAFLPSSALHLEYEYAHAFAGNPRACDDSLRMPRQL